MRALAIAILCGLLMPATTSGQEAGDRVRVTLSDPPRFQGVVARITPQELELASPWGDSRVVATSDILRIERREDRRQWKRGFMVGAGAGAAFAWLVPFTTDPPSFAKRIAHRCLMTAYVAPIYGVIGAAIGGLVKLEGWEPLEGWPRSGVTPEPLVEMRTMPDGSAAFGLGVKFRF